MRDNQKRKTISFATVSDMYTKCPEPWPCKEAHWLSSHPTELQAAQFRRHDVESEECWFITQKSEVLGSWVEDHSSLGWVWTNQTDRKHALSHSL